METGTITPALREQYRITCHCGAAAQTVTLPLLSHTPPTRTITICHCHECRHASGVLCATYLEIEKPSSLKGLVKHIDHDGDGASNVSNVISTARWFCGRCGGHVFARSMVSGAENGDGEKVRRMSSVFNDDGEDMEERSAEVEWAVATGCLVGRVDAEEGEDEGMLEGSLFEFRQVNIASVDGRSQGLAAVLPYPSVLCELGDRGKKGKWGKIHWASSLGSVMPFQQGDQAARVDLSEGQYFFVNHGTSTPLDKSEERLHLHCLCNRVSLIITRPDTSSTKPWSPQTDLMFPYHSTPEEILANKEDLKWWIRPAQEDGQRRYLSGTCTCRSCRLISGFEVQTWAFVPRTNIFVCQTDGAASTSAPAPVFGQEETKYLLHALDFGNPPTTALLRSYKSSPGVLREFCPDCGATVFWHNKERPDIIDISVGLMDVTEHQSSSCLPATKWLDWWTERVSFVEYGGSGRTGEISDMGRRVAGDLEQGLRAHGEGISGGGQV